MPLFWRFHRAHHTDLDFDVTTGVRFHPVEIFLSMGIKMTTVVLLGASAAAVILSAGAKGKRFALPNSEVMIHQPWGGAQGQATDIEITAKHIIATRERLNKILAKNTDQKLDKIEKDVDRDYFMMADEAKKYGIIDDIYKARS